MIGIENFRILLNSGGNDAFFFFYILFFSSSPDLVNKLIIKLRKSVDVDSDELLPSVQGLQLIPDAPANTVKKNVASEAPHSDSLQSTLERMFPVVEVTIS